MARKSKASLYLRKLRVLMEFLRLLMQMVSSHGGEDQDVYRLVKHENRSFLDGLAKQIAEYGLYSIDKILAPSTVNVDYSMSWQQMIARCKILLKSPSEGIQARCFLSGTGVVSSTISFIAFDRSVPFGEAYERAVRKGKKPALPEQVFAAAAIRMGVPMAVVIVSKRKPVPSGCAGELRSYLYFACDGIESCLSTEAKVLGDRKHYYVAVVREQPD